jgi:hypothetical protein
MTPNTCQPGLSYLGPQPPFSSGFFSIFSKFLFGPTLLESDPSSGIFFDSYAHIGDLPVAGLRVTVSGTLKCAPSGGSALDQGFGVYFDADNDTVITSVPGVTGVFIVSLGEESFASLATVRVSIVNGATYFDSGNIFDLSIVHDFFVEFFVGAIKLNGKCDLSVKFVSVSAGVDDIYVVTDFSDPTNSPVGRMKLLTWGPLSDSNGAFTKVPLMEIVGPGLPLRCPILNRPSGMDAMGNFYNQPLGG